MSHNRATRSDLSTLFLGDMTGNKPTAARAMFWRARYQEHSDFYHHIPTLFWLIETLTPRNFVSVGLQGNGVAYFAACQALDKLVPDARSYAVDPWTDTDGKVPEAIHAYNAHMYETLSEFIVDTSTRAAAGFDERQLDMLLLDSGCSPIECELQLQDWLPRLSDTAILLIHGTSNPSFSSDTGRAVLKGMAARYPSIHFTSAQGLTVLLVGEKRDEQLMRLVNLKRGTPGFNEVHQVFNRLGEAQHLKYTSQANETELKVLGSQLTASRNEAERLASQLATLKNDYNAYVLKDAAVQSENFTFRRQIADLERNLRDTQILNGDLRNEIAAAQADVKILRDRDALRDHEIVTLTSTAAQSVNQARSNAQRAANEARQSIDKLREEILALSSIANIRSNEIALLVRHAESQKEELKRRARVQAGLEHQVERAMRDYKAIVSSTSWKITGVLRNIVGKFRR